MPSELGFVVRLSRSAIATLLACRYHQVQFRQQRFTSNTPDILVVTHLRELDARACGAPPQYTQKEYPERLRVYLGELNEFDAVIAQRSSFASL